MDDIKKMVVENRDLICKLSNLTQCLGERLDILSEQIRIVHDINEQRSERYKKEFKKLKKRQGV